MVNLLLRFFFWLHSHRLMVLSTHTRDTRERGQLKNRPGSSSHVRRNAKSEGQLSSFTVCNICVRCVWFTSMNINSPGPLYYRVVQWRVSSIYYLATWIANIYFDFPAIYYVAIFTAVTIPILSKTSVAWCPMCNYIIYVSFVYCRCNIVQKLTYQLQSHKTAALQRNRKQIKY